MTKIKTTTKTVTKRKTKTTTKTITRDWQRTMTRTKTKIVFQFWCAHGFEIVKMVLAVLVEYESQLTAWPSLRYSRGTQAPPKPKLQKTSLTTFLIFINIIFLCCSTIVKHVLCMWWHSDGCQEERLGSRGGFLVTLESSCQMSPPPASDFQQIQIQAMLSPQGALYIQEIKLHKKIENRSSSPSRSQKCRPTTGQSLCLTKCNIGWKK